jgi:hypothetical protein
MEADALDAVHKELMHTKQDIADACSGPEAEVTHAVTCSLTHR